MLPRFLLVPVVLLLSACAQQPRLESLPRPARESIAGYVIEGRVAIRRGNESRQASIHWLHASDRDEIELSGPLGQKAAHLYRDSTGARLETSSRETIFASDWSGLAEKVLGVILPLDNIARWMTGSVPTDTAEDETGRPRHALENGWKIDYLAYESAAPNALPVLIQLRRDDIEVRLKIDQWQIGLD